MKTRVRTASSNRGAARRHRTVWALACLSAFSLVAACQRSDDSRRDGIGPWKEEVKLSDGRIIVVERFEDFKVNRLLGREESAFVKAASIKIVEPPELAALPELVIRQRPVIFDYDPIINTWYAIGVDEYGCSLDFPEAYHKGLMDKTGRVNIHPNFEYRLIDGAWKGVEIGAERIGLPANLLIQRTTIENFDVLPLSEKQRVDFDNAIPKAYRQVERTINCR